MEKFIVVVLGGLFGVVLGVLMAVYYLWAKLGVKRRVFFLKHV